jgi:CDP-diacylglycerol---glycerol-3-phosphate 3-phosphatidyltransferase
MRWIATPNKVTVLRMLVAGAAIGLYSAGSHGSRAMAVGICALALTICAIGLDGVDGYLARRLRMASALGAQLDILGDRVIENLFFIYFAASGQISVSVPVIFFVRGVLTDFLRGMASTRGPVDGGASAREFQRNWMLVEKWSARIVASRISRGAYAALKCACFCALGVEWIARHTQIPAVAKWNSAIHFAVSGIVFATVAFCVLRALPVFWEGLRDFRAVDRLSANSATCVAPSEVRVAARPMVSARWTS